MEWFTYTASQAKERVRVLEHLMKERLLTKEEEKVAGRLIQEFRREPEFGEEWLQIPTSEQGKELLDRLEDSLFESKQR